MRSHAFVATLNSFMRNQDIKTSNETKEEIVEGLSLRVTTTFEPVLEVETNLADSGAQSGSVSSSWLVVLLMVNYHIFQSQRARARATRH